MFLLLGHRSAIVHFSVFIATFLLLLKIKGDTLWSKLGLSLLIADGELVRLSGRASLYVL
jgi:hypothetical protein